MSGYGDLIVVETVLKIVLPVEIDRELWKKRRGGFAFHFVDIFHFVEIQSAFVYISRKDWIFQFKFCRSDPSFNRNILRPLYLEFKTSAHVHIAITYYFVLFTNFLTWYEF